MLEEYVLPSLGSGLKEATVLRWLIAPGERVTMGQPVCEVETEKSVIELPAPFSGVAERLIVAAGASAKVGHPIFSIRVEEAAGSQREGAPSPGNTQAEPKVPLAHGLQKDELPAASRRVVAMPGVRRLARERGVTLESVRGTGPRGRVRRQDVESSSGSHRVALTGLRRAIADHMSRSWREIPHVFTRMQIDAGPLLESKQLLSRKTGSAFPVEALLIYCAQPALQAHPEFNARFVDDAIEFHSSLDIAVATDLPAGLTLTVIAHTERLGLMELGSEVVRLTSQVRSQAFTPNALRNPTFTVNNVGARGLLTGTSIIPQGTSAILSLGRAHPQPVVRDGAVVAGTVAELSLSFDHRIIDGALAQRFMQNIAERLGSLHTGSIPGSRVAKT